MSIITKSGSKQYIVDAGQQIAVDKIITAQEGDIIELPVLLAFGVDKGTKTLKAKVVTPLGKGKKIRVVKYKNKTNYHKVQGFRHQHTILEILGDKPTAAKSAPAAKASKEDVKEKPASVKKETASASKKPASKTTAKKSTKTAK